MKTNSKKQLVNGNNGMKTKVPNMRDGYPQETNKLGESIPMKRQEIDKNEKTSHDKDRDMSKVKLPFNDLESNLKLIEEPKIMARNRSGTEMSRKSNQDNHSPSQKNNHPQICTSAIRLRQKEMVISL